MARHSKVDYKNLPDTDECIDHGQGREYGSTHGKRLHRVVFEMHYGFTPACVMHKCDNPRCINPKHLQAGDWNLNNKDRASKGRSAKAAPSRRKVSQDQADWVRRVYTPERGSEYCLTKLASMLMVDPNTIYNILKGRTHFA